ncbi:MAG: bacterial transcriptional activator domain-containing protein [Alphaproteobacteria bacterium]|nr:bacterial transcriptional activator domain-containing protein [Alphaproteobacteria bacterium]
MRIHFCVSVWGTRYIEQFDRFCLASLLSDGNLVHAAARHDCTFSVYTRGRDAVEIAAGPFMTRLARLLPVVYTTLEETAIRSNIDHWTPWHRAYCDALAADAALILIIPDVIYVSNALTRIIRHLSRQTPVVYFPIPQIAQEPGAIAVDQHCRERDGTLSIDDRDLLRLFANYIHPKHACALTASPRLTTHPEYLLTRSGAGFAIREVGSHPCAVLPRYAPVAPTFVPVSVAAQIEVLPALGLSLEATLKYLPLYAHWESRGVRRARLINLGSWAMCYRRTGDAHYADAGSVMVGGAAGAHPRPDRFAQRRCAMSLALIETVQAVFTSSRLLRGGVSRQVLWLAMVPLLSSRVRRVLRGSETATVFVPRRLSRAAVRSIAAGKFAAETFFCRHYVPQALEMAPGTCFALAQRAAAGGLCTAVYTEVPGVAAADPSAIAGRVRRIDVIMRGRLRVCLFDPLRPVAGQGFRDVRRSTPRREVRRALRGHFRASRGMRRREWVRRVAVHAYLWSLPGRITGRIAAHARRLYLKLRPSPAQKTDFAGAGQSLFDGLVSANMAGEPLRVVRTFNRIADLESTPVLELLARLHAELDRGLDWRAAAQDPNPLVRMQAALREAAQDRLGAAADIAEPLWRDPEYRRHAAASAWLGDAYARAMEFRARLAHRQGRQHEAVAYSLRALEVDPAHSALACRTAEMLWDLGHVAEATALLSRSGLISEINPFGRLPAGNAPTARMQACVDSISASLTQTILAAAEREANVSDR